ncbi:MAG: P-type conjugative transfer protein TrbJ [Geobacter sp.]|nr:MAG: P-type conjugative transfer protein TrbJ [Geobacter sp.]
MKWKTLFLAIVIFGMASTPSYAVFGIGDIVFDPSAFSQQMISYMNMVKQYVTQAQQYSTQLQQLAAQTQNLQNLNYMIDLTGMQDMQKIIQSARGIASDYSSLQRKYDERYPEFSKFSNMSGEDYAKKALEWNQETANSNRDAMDLISKTKDWFTSDSNDLRKLSVKANAVSGAKDGLQSIAQIAALQSKQLIQLQQTMSASAKAEGAYMAQKAEQEAAATARLQRWGKDFTPEKYIEGKGKPKKPYWEE